MSCNFYKSEKGIYEVKFWNPIIKKLIHIGSYDNEEECKIQMSKKDILFYKENTRFLPKGVTVSINDFHLKVFSKTVSDKSEKKYKLVGSAKTLNEIKEIRSVIIQSLLDI